eukprot:36333_1
MSHTILDDKTDKTSIESFVRGTEVDLKRIVIGTQMYYLYKEDDDTNHTIEFNWYWGCVIEINKNKKNDEHYHMWHDDEDPWIDLSKDRTDWKVIPPTSKYYDNTFDINQYLIINKKKSNPKKKRSKSKKKSKRTRSTSSTTNDAKYDKGTPGFALIVPKTPIPCVITHGPVTFKGTHLKFASSTTHPYTFWCRSKDIKPILNQPQTVTFEWNGQASQYLVIEQNDEKQFVECFWRKDVNKTWIAIDNFVLPSQSRSVGDHDGGIAQNSEDKSEKRGSSKRHKHQSKMEMDATPIPPMPAVQPRNRKMDYSLSQPVNRMTENRQRKTQFTRAPIHSVANAVNVSQTASSIARYQRLQNEKFYARPFDLHNRRCCHHGNMQHMAHHPHARSMNHSYSIPTGRPRFKYTGNAFTSPLHNQYHSHAGHKRRRSMNAHTSPNVLPPAKRQKLNETMQLVAIQPPQPNVNVTMPELQRSPTPNQMNKKKYVLSDDVSSIESGVESESPNMANVNEVIVSDDESENALIPCMNQQRGSRSRRVSRSAPPAASRESNVIGFDERVMTVWFPMISLSQITDKLTDKSISNQERIHSLKSVVLCLTKCQNTMNKISNQIGSQCQNVKRCVEAIIQDLQRT